MTPSEWRAIAEYPGAIWTFTPRGAGLTLDAGAACAVADSVHDRMRFVRRRSANTLERAFRRDKQGAAACFETLWAARDDRSPGVRGALMLALARGGAHPEVVGPWLLQMCRAPHPRDRAHAYRALIVMPQTPPAPPPREDDADHRVQAWWHAYARSRT